MICSFKDKLHLSLDQSEVNQNQFNCDCLSQVFQFFAQATDIYFINVILLIQQNPYSVGTLGERADSC